MAAGGGGEGGKSADDVMDEAAASVQDRLPSQFPLDICEQKFPTMYEESMNTVVKQELGATQLDPTPVIVFNTFKLDV